MECPFMTGHSFSFAETMVQAIAYHANIDRPGES
ncbi:hypothetical protein AGR2A_Lc180118 [Agrobacterium genomosp. 2 str. CFBP 5494]|uniref:Uncharacterized protein n=1 Tax=Agrobacterium genomosp. 2 str. CFBP 5494 TaxID=1183436 RepID=A0A9W5F1S0_9HYPH|nr:hypothetical protein AGR2A_Lc180118 [Agrobacterium genomosp. 2 str. CFBP 5494]